MLRVTAVAHIIAVIERAFLSVQGPITPHMDDEVPLPRVIMEPKLQMDSPPWPGAVLPLAQEQLLPSRPHQQAALGRSLPQPQGLHLRQPLVAHSPQVRTQAHLSLRMVAVEVTGWSPSVGPCCHLAAAIWQVLLAGPCSEDAACGWTACRTPAWDE